MKTDHDRFELALRRILDRWEVTISPGQLDLLKAHFEAVIDTNRTMNLTRITEPLDAAVKHYADSLAMLLWAHKRRIAVKTLLDVGTGAGYPAVPLAVMRPDWSVTAIDATGKKVRFLARLADELQLPNLHLEHAHSLHWPEKRRFQVVVLRGIGPLTKCLEQAAPYVARGGRLVAYKTATLPHQELQLALERARQLGFRPDEPFAYELELEGEILRRALHIYRKRS